jgi:hypothetical protein
MKSRPSDPLSSDENPGVPGFRTWRGIYFFVFLWFVFAVALLALFSRWFA